MKEYTIAAIVSVALVILFDRILKTRLSSRPEFWAFIGVMFGFKLIFNGYLTWRPIVLYRKEFFLDVRLGTIPAEDFMFGFSMITLTIVLWEFIKKRQMDAEAGEPIALNSTTDPQSTPTTKEIHHARQAE
jgi:lycopene cyclase domain-containing protein